MAGKIVGEQLENATVTSTQIDTSTGTLSTINAGDAGSDGSGDGVAFKNHQHPYATGAASAIGQGNSEGSSSDSARSDHDHKLKESGGTEMTLAAIADGELVKRVGTTLVGVAMGAGIGDVVGPGSSTDHGIARWDLTTGKLLQDTSGPTMPDDGTIDMASKKITSLLAGSAATDAVNKQQLDDAITGLDTKKEAQLATAAALPANTAGGSGVGKTLTADANGALSVDGVAVANGDRILVKDEATGADNGIYAVTDLGSGGTPYILTRATDSDQDAEVTSGSYVFVIGGNTLAQSGWLLTTADAITVDTTAQTWSQFNGLAQITAGAGMTKTGNTLDVIANGDGSITVNANDVQVGILATDAQHGVRGGGTQHALAVAGAPGTPGFISGTDQDKLDNVAAGATAIVPRQEKLTTETITNTDTAMVDTLDNTPVSNASVSLYLNGVHQTQGAGEDYTISGVTITWLASSGSAINQKTTHKLVAVYSSAT